MPARIGRANVVPGSAELLSVQGRYTYCNYGVPAPDEDLVACVTGLLHQIDGGVGYVVFDDLGEELGLVESKRFQVALINAVWEEMIRRNWNPCARIQARLNLFEANDGSLPIEIVGDTVTYKKLHFDPHSIVFSHLYETPENLCGGLISLVNVRGYLDATGLHFNDVFRPSRRLGHELRMVVRDEHHSTLSKYQPLSFHPVAVNWS